jgi:hypothetical protein
MDMDACYASERGFAKSKSMLARCATALRGKHALRAVDTIVRAKPRTRFTSSNPLNNAFVKRSANVYDGLEGRYL